jgi:DNA-directed RNA polymerase subunit beta'
MTKKAIITQEGNSKFITGELIEISKLEYLNKKLIKKIKYEPILIGISKISVTSQSFIAAASFQETTKVLSNSAIEGKIDWLYGLKENIVLGIDLNPNYIGYSIIKFSKYMFFKFLYESVISYI